MDGLFGGLVSLVPCEPPCEATYFITLSYDSNEDTLKAHPGLAMVRISLISTRLPTPIAQTVTPGNINVYIYEYTVKPRISIFEIPAYSK